MGQKVKLELTFNPRDSWAWFSERPGGPRLPRCGVDQGSLGGQLDVLPLDLLLGNESVSNGVASFSIDRLQLTDSLSSATFSHRRERPLSLLMHRIDRGAERGMTKKAFECNEDTAMARICMQQLM